MAGLVWHQLHEFGKNGVEMDKFYPPLEGMVSCSTHKFSSGHRSASMGGMDAHVEEQIDKKKRKEKSSPW
jgi:hypothetical protein